MHLAMFGTTGLSVPLFFLSLCSGLDCCVVQMCRIPPANRIPKQRFRILGMHNMFYVLNVHNKLYISYRTLFYVSISIGYLIVHAYFLRCFLLKINALKNNYLIMLLNVIFSQSQNEYLFCTVHYNAVMLKFTCITSKVVLVFSVLYFIYLVYF